ncbi:MAG: hypothetical protein RDU20_12960 [Desulfomonilaceae bacterium]|nr:hypothetical protein [Desulfomonilaceae bacterium]
MSNGKRTRIIAWILLIATAAATVPLGLRLMAARGPHWLGHNNDPHYHYLVDSLHAARFKVSSHVDHPGTTVQLIGAAAIRVKHVFSGQSELVRDVLKNPEPYANAISYTLLMIHAVLVFAAGVIAFKATGNIFLALLIQIGPHLSVSSLDSLTRPKPESLLLSLSCLMGALVLAHLWKRDSSKGVRIAVMLGIVTGLAIVTKITAAVLAIIPLLILDDRRSRLTYLAAAFLAALIAFLPVIIGGRLTRFFTFILQLSTHTGLYGQGAAAFIDVSAYVAAIGDLARYERLLFTVVCYAAGLLVWCRITTDETSDLHKALRRGLFAVTLAMAVQILVTAKHPLYHYLVPALGLLGLSGALILGLLLERREQVGATSGAGLFLTMLFLIAAFQGTQWVALVKMLDRCRDTQLTIVRNLERYEGWTQVCAFGSSAIPLGLSVGNAYAGGEYGVILKQLYPDFIAYPTRMDATNRILLRGSRLHDDEEIKDVLEEVYSGLEPEDRRWADRHGMERLFRLKGQVR